MSDSSLYPATVRSPRRILLKSEVVEDDKLIIEEGGKQTELALAASIEGLSIGCTWISWKAYEALKSKGNSLKSMLGQGVVEK